jgi:uncharacterized membrane protein
MAVDPPRSSWDWAVGVAGAALRPHVSSMSFMTALRRYLSVDVRRELLAGRTPDLHRRRSAATIASGGAAVSLLVGLHQLGILKHLPDPPGRLWDSSHVTQSPAAYLLGVPDAPLAAVGFGAAVVLASRLGASRPGQRPWVGRLFGAAALGLATGAAAYLAEMLLRQRRLCVYCLSTALASFALVPLAWPDLSGRAPA